MIKTKFRILIYVAGTFLTKLNKCLTSENTTLQFAVKTVLREQKKSILQIVNFVLRTPRKFITKSELFKSLPYTIRQESSGTF